MGECVEPRGLLRGHVFLQFEHAATGRPSDFGWSQDQRELAIWFTTVDLFCLASGRRICHVDFAGDRATGVEIYGLSHVETDGRWSRGPRTGLLLKLDELPPGPVRFEVVHRSMGPRGNPAARVTVNGTPVGEFQFTGGLVSFEVADLHAIVAPGGTSNVSLVAAADVEVSIIIPNYNRPDLTFAAVVSALASRITAAFEVIVVDNGSDAVSRELLREMSLPARIIFLTERVGFGSANNLAAEAARGRVLLLLNNDAFLAPGCVDRLVAELAGHNAGAAGPALRFPDGTLQENGRWVTAVGSTVTPLGNGYSWDLTESFEVDYVSGACLAVTTRAYLAIGGFDPMLDPAYVEDVELCLRLRAAGQPVRFVPDALAYHIMGASSTRGAVDLRASHAERNRLVMLSRWGKWLATRQPEHAPRPLSLNSAALKRQGARFPTAVMHAVIVAQASVVGPQLRAAVAMAAALGRERPTAIASPTALPVLDVCQLAAGMGLPTEGLTTCSIDELTTRDLDIVVVVDDLPGAAPPPLGRRRVLFQPPGVVVPPADRPALRSRLGGMLNFDVVVFDSAARRSECQRLIAELDGPPVVGVVLPSDLPAGATPPAGSSRQNVLVSLGVLAADAAGGRHEAALRALRRLVSVRPGEQWKLVVAGDFPPVADPTFFKRLTELERGPIDIDIFANPVWDGWTSLMARARVLVVVEDAAADRPRLAAEIGAAIRAGCVPVICGDGTVAELCREHQVGIRCAAGGDLAGAVQEAATVADAGIPAETVARFVNSMQESRRAVWNGITLDSAAHAPPPASARSGSRDSPEPDARPAAFLVVGCHRSGTSVMARLLSLAGADLPHDLMPPALDNPSGFWESLGVVAWNDGYLQACGSSWDDPLAFFSAARRDPPAAAAINEAADRIRRAYPGDRAIVVKDPRISLVSRVWIDALRRAGYAPVVIAMLRDPRDVVASLAVRNGLSIARAGAIWLGSTLAIDLDITDVPRRWVSYDSLLAAPLATVRSLRSMHDVGFVSRDNGDDRMASFVDPRQRNHRGTGDHRLEVDRVILDYHAWLMSGHGPADTRARAAEFMAGLRGTFQEHGGV